MERTKKKIDMDYEKKYKEALKDMRAIYPNLKGDAKLAVEHAFPELRESEDERMINELQGFLCSFGSDYFGNGEWQKFDDWLEKQKEQKPADDEAKAIAYREYERGRESGLRDGQKYVLDNAESYGLCKPAEWGEGDETMLRTIISDGSRGVELDSKQISWLKSLRSRPKPSDNWKPSDEQPQVADASKMEQEVDFEKEIDKGIADYSFTKTIDSGGFKTTVIDYAKIARHFYELGLNARKEG